MDPYVYPGTDVLRNLRDIRNAEQLSRAEAIATARRIAELHRNPKIGSFDAQHLQSIHRHIFKDLYPWAGAFRTVEISRSGQIPYAFSQQIIPSVNKISAQLGNEGYLKTLSLGKFSNRAAFYMGELNAVHPFRDGNGRTQREFIRQLAVRNGYALDWSRVSRDEMYEASRASFQKGDNSGLERTLQRALDSEHNRTKEQRQVAAGRHRGDRKEERER